MVFDNMKTLGHRPNVITYTSLLYAYGAKGNPDLTKCCI